MLRVIVGSAPGWQLRQPVLVLEGALCRSRVPLLPPPTPRCVSSNLRNRRRGPISLAPGRDVCQRRRAPRRHGRKGGGAHQDGPHVARPDHTLGEQRPGPLVSRRSAALRGKNSCWHFLIAPPDHGAAESCATHLELLPRARAPHVPVAGRDRVPAPGTTRDCGRETRYARRRPRPLFARHDGHARSSRFRFSLDSGTAPYIRLRFSSRV